jgi:endonuclease/exonuclease/phosphatase family metal-dependent hydrolase
VRAYSVHLESPAGTSGNGRRRQLEALLADIEPHRRHVVVAGDFNNTGIAAEAFSAAGFDWVTQHVGRTIALFSWDHIFVRGLPLLDAGSAGAVADNRDSSDHRPVWARLAVPADPQAGASSR